MSKFDLVKIVQEDKLPELSKRDDLLEFLNSTPPDVWLDNAPGGKSKTMPIGRIEWLLTNIFRDWWVEVVREGAIFNSIYCTVRVHYQDPVTDDWRQQDGTGAVPAKTSAGSKASDMSSILSDAVQTGLPSAKSFAIKDACDHIGRIFGRDINRKGSYGFSGAFNQDATKVQIEDAKQKAVREAIEQINASKNLEALRQIFIGLGTLQANQEVYAAKEAKKKELTSEGIETSAE